MSTTPRCGEGFTLEHRKATSCILTAWGKPWGKLDFHFLKESVDTPRVNSLAANDEEAGEEGACVYAMRLRVYPTARQLALGRKFFWITHRFRNEACAFLADRRKARGAWIRENLGASSKEIPKHLSGDDAVACSKWMTSRLQAARRAACLGMGLPLKLDVKKIGPEVVKQFAFLTREEQEEIPDGFLLLCPRTILDQVVRDLGKTNKRAIDDRAKAKQSKQAKQGKQKKSPGSAAASSSAGSSSAGSSLVSSMSRKERNAERKAVRKALGLSGFPKARKRQSFASSVRFQVVAKDNKSFRQHWEAGEIYIPGVGKLSFRDQLSLPKTPPSLITLSRNAAGHWHVSFACAQGEGKSHQVRNELFAKPLLVDPEGNPVLESIDLSMRETAVDSSGKKLGRVRHLKRYLGIKKKLSRSLSRKQKGSARRGEARQKLGKLEVKIAAERKLHLSALASELIARSPILCIEDLSVARMLQNRHLSQSLHDVAFGLFVNLLYQHAAKHGHLVLRAGRFDPTSQLCSACGYRNKGLTLKETSWACPGCNTTHDRDHNAAINVKRLALEAAINVLAEENSVRKLSSHQLKPDLEAFIARGGLTALLERAKVGIDETRNLPLKPILSRRERLKMG